MMDLFYTLQVYFMQDLADENIYSLLVLTALFLGTTYIVFKYYKKHEYAISEIIIGFCLLSVISYFESMHPLLHVHQIHQHTKYEEVTEYYSLHFNPNEEGIVFDEEGKVYRLNGDEELIQISEELSNKINSIKIKKVYAIIQDSMVDSLKLCLKSQDSLVDNKILLDIDIVEENYTS